MPLLLLTFVISHLTLSLEPLLAAPLLNKAESPTACALLAAVPLAIVAKLNGASPPSAATILVLLAVAKEAAPETTLTTRALDPPFLK